MQNKENKNKLGKHGIILLSLAVLFLISFSTSAWIYIKSNDLVFTDTVEEYEEKYKKVAETEERIEELEAQVERYKSMYEGAIEDNKLLSKTTSSEISMEKKEADEKESKNTEEKSVQSEKEENSENINDIKENGKQEEDKKTLEKETENKESKKGKITETKEEE